MPKTTAPVALGILALLIAVAVPASIAVINDPAQGTFDLDEGDTVTVTQTLDVIIEETTQTDATVTLRDSETLSSETQTLSEGQTAEYTVDNESMNVTLRAAQGANANATVLVEYPRTYGWDSGAKTFIENMPFILVVVLGFVLIGAVGAMRQ